MCTKNIPHDLLLKYIISNTFQSISLDILKILITFTNIKGYKGWDIFNSRRGIKITQSSFALLYKVILPFKKKFCEHKETNKKTADSARGHSLSCTNHLMPASAVPSSLPFLTETCLPWRRKPDIQILQNEEFPIKNMQNTRILLVLKKHYAELNMIFLNRKVLKLILQKDSVSYYPRNRSFECDNQLLFIKPVESL